MLHYEHMQKIVPFVWFDMNCEEAINFYTSAFPNSKITGIKRYPTDVQVGPLENMGGKVLTASFEIDGYEMMALDGGPYFKHTPAQSISVQCATVDELNALHDTLREGGSDLMPISDYPFSKRYAWINDKYGLSWQLNVPHEPVEGSRFAHFKMFYGANSGKAEEAMNYYVSVFTDSKITGTWRHETAEAGGTPGTLAHAEYTLLGTAQMCMDSALPHAFETTGALSSLVRCANQDEIDLYWSKLSADPMSEQCGWCKDKYGFAWQIVPEHIDQWLSGSDSVGSARAMAAMMTMKKIDIKALEDAYAGVVQ